MEYTRILENNNRITNSIYPRTSPETTSGLTMRFVFGGSDTCTVGRRQLSTHNDSFVVFNKGTQFKSVVNSSDNVNIFSVVFDEDFLNDFNRVWGPQENLLSDQDDGNVLQADLVETIYPFKPEMKLAVLRLKECLESGCYDEDLINACLCRCLLGYYEIYEEEILNKAKKLNFLHYSTRIEILRRLNLAREYLYANYSRNVNLEGLADHACLSVNHLLRTFKLAYNQSPHQFLIQLRLQRAQLLLMKTEYPVYEIVNMVGFKCTSSFIRLFRTRYKTTPLKYRNVIAA